MAMVMRGFSPSASPAGGHNSMKGIPAPGSQQRHYPVVPTSTVQDGLVAAAGGIPMGLMDPAAMMDPSYVAGGFFPPQQPRPQPYRDFSRISIEETTAQEESPSGAGAGKEPPFPAKLHRILSNPEFHEYITWLPHGRSWRVLKPKAFEEKVIPLYFRHAKYASFMRQVNGWGFKRMTQGPDHNSYYHEMFLRGLPQLCSKMRRSSRTKNAAMDTDAHPDFYRISMFAPLPGQTTPANSAAGEQASAAGAAAAAIGGNTSENEGASKDSDKHKKPGREDGQGSQPPNVPSTSNFTGSPTSSHSLQQQQVLQSQLDPSIMHKDMNAVASQSFAGTQFAPEWPQMQDAMARQMVVGHPGIPGMPMPYASDPVTAAAQVQYEQQLMAAAPAAALMPLGGNPGLNMMYQNQALLAQIQAQMIQAQGHAPAPPAAGNANGDASDANSAT